VKEMKKIFVVFVLVLLIATIFGASSSALAPKGGGGKPPKDPPDPTPADPAIAYRGGNRDDFGLWVMDADGSHQTYVGIGCNAHCWSPDGTSIAFTRGAMNEPVMQLWCIDITVDAEGNVQGSNERRLLSGGIGNCIPAWSPNGDHIAYTRALDDVNGVYYSIWLYNVADGTTEKIYTDPVEIDISGPLMYLTWDPTGTKLAFVKDTVYIDSTWYSPKIKTIDIITKEVNTIYAFPEGISIGSYSGGLDWANNDDKLVLNLGYWGNHQIAIYDISESSITTLSTTTNIGILSWSPDDSKLAYTYNDPGAKGKRPKLYINTINVSTQEIVTLGAGSMADWCIV
jgi:Tol biopolymer transport system component